MSNSRLGKRAICPYYKDANIQKHEIICEGIMDNTAIHLTFGDTTDHTAHFDYNCCSYHYDTCPLARMLDKKYE